MSRAQGPPPEVDYKMTVNLPETDFDLRANSTVREPEIQKMWEEHGLYKRLYQSAKGVGHLGIRGNAARMTPPSPIGRRTSSRSTTARPTLTARCTSGTP
jgi:hypothetical protein